MKTFGGWGGRSAKKHWSLGALGMALVIALGVSGLSGDASGSAIDSGVSPAPFGGGAGTGTRAGGEKPPIDLQECVSDHLRNQSRCKEIWCEPASLFWISWTSCKDRYLTQCLGAAKQAYECCINGGPPCGGD